MLPTKLQSSFKVLKTVPKCSLKNHMKPLSSTETLEPVKLSYATYESTVDIPEGQAPPLVIMHGLLGSKGNWNSLCKVYQQKANPVRKIIAIDARNHGDSTHSDNHTYAHMAADIRALLHQLHLEKVSLMGHSMGGRATMLFALKYPELVDRLVVADISPVRTSPQLDSMPALFQAIENVNLPSNIALSQARTLVDSQLAKTIPDKSLRSFLLTNLIQRETGSYNWRINIPVLLSCFNNISRFPLVNDVQYTGPVLFIGGGNSDYIKYHDNSTSKVFALDARNHGDSPHSKEHLYDDLVVDIRRFMYKQNITKINLLGHSMGGRAAMLFALKYPELVDKLIVADISPITTSVNLKRMTKLLVLLKNTQFPKNVSLFEARRSVRENLLPFVKSEALTTFLLTNLVQKPDGSYGWRFNVKALINNIDSITTFPEIHHILFEGPVLFVGGGKSDYIQKSDFPKILKLFPNAELKFIEGAGHWLHSEKPAEFLQLTLDFLNKEVTNL